MLDAGTRPTAVNLPLTEDGHVMVPGESLFVVDRDRPRRRPIRDRIEGLIWLGHEAGWLVQLERCDVLPVQSPDIGLFHGLPESPS